MHTADRGGLLKLLNSYGLCCKPVHQLSPQLGAGSARQGTLVLYNKATPVVSRVVTYVHFELCDMTSDWVVHKSVWAVVYNWKLTTAYTGSMFRAPSDHKFKSDFIKYVGFMG